MFEDTFLALTTKSQGRITTKTASHIACELTIGLFGRIYQQIDPVNLGEMCRAMKVAKDYGDRLQARSKNLRKDAIYELTAGYSDHGFVIDRDEASKLFLNIRNPNADELKLVELLGALAQHPVSGNEPAFDFLCDEIIEEPVGRDTPEPSETSHHE